MIFILIYCLLAIMALATGIMQAKAYDFNISNKNTYIGSMYKSMTPYKIIWIILILLTIATIYFHLKKDNKQDEIVIGNNTIESNNDNIKEETKKEETNNKIDDSYSEKNDNTENGGKKVIINENTKNSLKGKYELTPIADGYYIITTDDNGIISENIAIADYIIPTPITNNNCSTRDKFRNIYGNGLDYNGFIYDYINGKNKEKVVIAIIDSGIDTDNKTLVGHISKNNKEISDGKDNDQDGYIDNINGINVEYGNGYVNDELGHGTHIAGIILQTFPNAEILPIKVSNGTNHKVTEISLIEGIRYAIDHNVDIINISLGSKNNNKIEETIINEAINKGIIVIAAAGNNGEDITLFFPGGYDNVLSVGSIKIGGKKSIFSNYNATTDLPGECIYSYGLNNKREYADGTSFSAPHLAGMLGVYKSIGNAIGTGDNAESIIEKSTRKLGNSDVIQISKLLGIEKENDDFYENIANIKTSLNTIKDKLEKIDYENLNNKDIDLIVGYSNKLTTRGKNLENIYTKLGIQTGFGIDLKKDIDAYTKLLKDINPNGLYLTVEGGNLKNSLGVSTCKDSNPNQCGRFSRIIQGGTTLPQSNHDEYVTMEDYQTDIDFDIYQGENDIANKNTYLGSIHLSGIQPKKKGQARAIVYFDIDNSGKLTASAVDKDNTSNKITTTIKNIQRDSKTITGDNYTKVVNGLKSIGTKTKEILLKINNFNERNNPFDNIQENIEGASLNEHINKLDKIIINNTGNNSNINIGNNSSNCDLTKCEYGKITNIVDGDTIDMGSNRIRLLGINTPETVDPEKEVECYGPEATERIKQLVLWKNVCACRDTISENKDKYDRLLRYIYLDNGESVNEIMLKEGYSKEYSKYDFGLKNKYAKIANEAMKKNIGIYKCSDISLSKETVPSLAIPTTSLVEKNNCVIKGNINSKGEKIYHLPGCQSYKDTIITISKGEKWFCTEEEAKTAGWRKAKNC